MKVRITALAPMHFAATPLPLTTLDYAFSNNKCYVLSEDRLLKALADKGATDAFMEWLSKPKEPVKSPERNAREPREQQPWSLLESRPERPRQHRLKPAPSQTHNTRPDITSFLRRQGLLKEADLAAMSRYAVPCRVPPGGDVRTVSRTAEGAPYLPATAVKGALRIAVAYQLLKAMPDKARRELLDDFVASELARFRRDPRSAGRPGWFHERVKQVFAGQLDHQLMQRFRLGEDASPYGPNTDVFRALRVSDSKPLDQGAVSICNVRIYSAHARTNPKAWTILAECIWIGATFELDVHIDEPLLEAFAKANDRTGYGLPFSAVAEMVREPFRAAEAMTADLYAAEQRFFEHELAMPGAADLRGQTPTLRMGWGTTMLGTSVSLLLPDDLRTDLRNTLYDSAGQTYAPKSRKLVEMAGNTFSMGWAKAEVA